jgi:hypothetical protein
VEVHDKVSLLTTVLVQGSHKLYGHHKNVVNKNKSWRTEYYPILYKGGTFSKFSFYGLHVDIFPHINSYQTQLEKWQSHLKGRINQMELSNFW